MCASSGKPVTSSRSRRPEPPRAARRQPWRWAFRRSGRRVASGARPSAAIRRTHPTARRRRAGHPLHPAPPGGYHCPAARARARVDPGEEAAGAAAAARSGPACRPEPGSAARYRAAPPGSHCRTCMRSRRCLPDTQAPRRAWRWGPAAPHLPRRPRWWPAARRSPRTPLARRAHGRGGPRLSPKRSAKGYAGAAKQTLAAGGSVCSWWAHRGRGQSNTCHGWTTLARRTGREW
jgi:hypothetical protein